MNKRTRGFPLERRLFDPLRYLEHGLRLEVSLDKDGSILLKGISSLPAKKRRQAKKVLDTYEKLLRIQLDAPARELRPSVQKLMAQGKISIKNGQYVLVSTRFI